MCSHVWMRLDNSPWAACGITAGQSRASLPNCLLLKQTPVWLRFQTHTAGESHLKSCAWLPPPMPKLSAKVFPWQEEGKNNKSHKPLKKLLLLACWGSWWCLAGLHTHCYSLLLVALRQEPPSTDADPRAVSSPAASTAESLPCSQGKESSKMKQQRFPWSKSTVVSSNSHKLMCP